MADKTSVVSSYISLASGVIEWSTKNNIDWINEMDLHIMFGDNSEIKIVNITISGYTSLIKALTCDESGKTVRVLASNKTGETPKRILEVNSDNLEAISGAYKPIIKSAPPTGEDGFPSKELSLVMESAGVVVPGTVSYLDGLGADVREIHMYAIEEYGDCYGVIAHADIIADFSKINKGVLYEIELRPSTIVEIKR